MPLKKTGLVGRIILFILCIIDLLQGFSIMVSVMRGGHAMPMLLVKYCETSTFPTRATLTRLRKSSEVLTSLVTLIWAQLILFSPGCWTVGSLSTKHYIWRSNLGFSEKNICHTPRQTVFVHNYRLKKEKEKKVRRFRETHRYENWKRIEALSDDNLRDPWPYKFFNRVRDRENSPRLTNKL